MGHESLPPRRSPTQRDRSPTRHGSSNPDVSSARRKHARLISPSPRSPSPRTKRLTRNQAEKEAEKITDREHNRNHDRGNGRSSKREGVLQKEIENERKERSSRDDIGDKSSRSRHGRSTSPSDRHRRTKHKSHSPKHNGEKISERDYERSGRGRDKGTQRERGANREIEDERVDKRSGRDDIDHLSLRSRHNRSTSPSYRQHKSRRRSRSPQPAADTRDRDEAPTSRGIGQSNDEDDESIAKMKVAEDALEAKQKQKPSFELSGKLAAETNRFRGVTLLYNEPPDAYKPDVRWRLYVFKAGEVLNEPLYIHRQSCYLFGRERRVADIPTDHPSCSKQHAVIQYRRVEREQPDGMLSKQVRPYLMDLGSTNKTFLNEVAIEPQRYYELHEKDTIKFGNSSREYVLLHENSAT